MLDQSPIVCGKLMRLMPRSTLNLKIILNVYFFHFLDESEFTCIDYYTTVKHLSLRISTSIG